MTDLDLAAYRADLRRFVLRLTGNADLADDIVQDTMVRALASPASFAGRSRPLTWLSAIALNVLRDHYRRPASRAETELDEAVLSTLPAGEQSAEMALLTGEMGACITAHVMALPERLRDVLILHHMAEASHAEIAAALDISEGNARVLLHRGRAALKERLASQCRLDFAGDAIPCTPRDGEAS